MLDNSAIARRTLDFEDYLDILRRNVAWIIAPIFAGLVMSTVVAYLLPDTYESRAVIRIVPQQINEQLVPNASAQDMTGRVEQLRQTILSRTALINLITSNGLYKQELKSEPMEDVVAKMRLAVGIIPKVGFNGPQNKGSLTVDITFKYRDRLVANKICADLVSRFLSNGSAGTQNSQQQTFDFLQSEATKAKAELDEAEKQLADYRGRHAGALPEEMQGNFAELSAMQQRLNSLNDAQTRASERRLLIDSALRSAKERVAGLRQLTPTSQARNDRTSELDKRIADMETSIAAMTKRYTAEMPELQTAQENLAVLKKQRDEASKAPAPKNADAESPFMVSQRLDAQAQVDQLETQLKATSLEEQQTSRAIIAANGQLAAVQARLSASPAGEKEYADLLQARESARLKWASADAKAHTARISSDLESAKQGETLEMLDDASVPVDPTEPKRGLIIPIGAVAGLFLGIILVAVREVRDTSLKNLKDARVYTQLTVLGSIPLLENDVVIQRRKQVALVSWAVAGLVGIAIAAGSVAHYYISKV
jgi:uncharacterized protein involved in exopolysaccharide biosynthesis